MKPASALRVCLLKELESKTRAIARRYGVRVSELVAWRLPTGSRAGRPAPWRKIQEAVCRACRAQIEARCSCFPCAFRYLLAPLWFWEFPMNDKIRNIAIIAHVDHGKTTLVDKLLREGGAWRANQAVEERAMDSLDLEREKGITIRAKNASVHWEGVTINIVDTPGHADFGGEVERALNMVDGVLLLVDAFDGPQAQTRFVLRKALQLGLQPIVVINKIDREHAHLAQVHDQVLELLLELNATPKQFDAPFLYASARDGYALRQPGDPRQGMRPLFEAILRHIPPPQADPNGHFQMLVSNLDWSDYVGRIAIGKIFGGRVKVGDSVMRIAKDGARVRATVTKIFEFSGTRSAESHSEDAGVAGNIIGLAGFEEIAIGETICDSEERAPIPFSEIDPPTIQMEICVNDSPLAGRDGRFVTSNQLRERLFRETRTNISLSVAETGTGTSFRISARGEMQIAVLVEQMRREGYELLVSRPEVILRKRGDQTLEPFETLWMELPAACLGDILQALSARRGQITTMTHHGNHVRLEALIPTRGLIGWETDLINRTSGRAVMSHMFKEYAPHCGEIVTRLTGTLVSMGKGLATAWQLDNLQARGKLFIGPGEEVYEGMIVGETPRKEDVSVNPAKSKPLSNVRAGGASDKAIALEPPLKMSLERAIEWIGPDEYLEVTPKHLRFRKKILNETKRRRSGQNRAERAFAA